MSGFDTGQSVGNAKSSFGGSVSTKGRTTRFIKWLKERASKKTKTKKKKK